MNPGSHSPAPRIIARTIAVAVAAQGIYTALDLSRDFAGGGLSWIISSIEAGVAVLCLVVACKGWYCRTAGSVRWLCGVAAFIFFVFILFAFDRASLKLLGFPLVDVKTDHLDPPRALARAILKLLPAVAAIVFYHSTVRWLLPRLGLNDDRTTTQRLWSAKTAFGLIAIMVFAAGGDLGDLAFQTRDLPAHQIRGPDIWDLVFTFGPVVLAIAVYKLGVYFAARRIARAANPKPTASTLPGLGKATA